MIIRELWHSSSEKSVILPVEKDVTDPSKLLVKSLYSLVSTGTECRVSKGLVPARLWQSMQVPNMDGSFAFPVKYGYSLVGIVVDGHNDWIGKHIHVMHPHQDFAIVAPDQISLIPEEVPVKRAVLASVMETAVNAVWDSGVTVGDKVLINGFGLIGATLSLVISQIPGICVFVHEINDDRSQLAQSMNFKLFQERENGKFDLAFNCSAKGDGLQFCIDNTDYEGTIVEMSWFGSEIVGLSLGVNFHILRQRIISSQVSQIPGAKLNRWNFKRRKDLVFDLLKNPVFDGFLTKNVPFCDAPEIFNSLRKKNLDDLCITFTY